MHYRIMHRNVDGCCLDDQEYPTKAAAITAANQLQARSDATGNRWHYTYAVYESRPDGSRVYVTESHPARVCWECQAELAADHDNRNGYCLTCRKRFWPENYENGTGE